MPSGHLSLDLIRIIISFAPLHALPSLSGTNREVASLALQDTRARLRDRTYQAVLIKLNDETVAGMGITAVCKIIKAYDDMQSFLVHPGIDISRSDLGIQFGCFICEREGGTRRRLTTKGVIRKPHKLPQQYFVCKRKRGSVRDNGCGTGYTIFFKRCRRGKCPFQEYVVRNAPRLGK